MGLVSVKELSNLFEPIYNYIYFFLLLFAPWILIKNSRFVIHFFMTTPPSFSTLTCSFRASIAKEKTDAYSSTEKKIF